MVSVPGSQRTRQVYCSPTAWSHSISSSALDSWRRMPEMASVKARFTYSAFAPLSGWVRTTGCVSVACASSDTLTVIELRWPAYRSESPRRPY